MNYFILGSVREAYRKICATVWDDSIHYFDLEGNEISGCDFEWRLRFVDEPTVRQLCDEIEIVTVLQSLDLTREQKHALRLAVVSAWSQQDLLGQPRMTVEQVFRTDDMCGVDDY